MFRRTESPDERLYCCYGCRLAEEITGATGAEGQVNWILARMGTAIVLSMAVMVFTLPTYAGDVLGSPAEHSTNLATQWTGLLRFASLLLTIPVFLLLGVPILRNAFQQLRVGVVTTDVLIVIGVAAAFLYSVASTVLDTGQTYFESVCMVLVLVTLGRYLETRGKVSASNAVLSLDSLLPDDVDVLLGQQHKCKPLAEVTVGDVVVVKAGQTCPADGTVVDGQGHIDEQLVTGESTPLEKSQGDKVVAGSTVLDTVLSIRVEAVGSECTVGRMARLLEQAKSSKGRFARLADRVAAVFVPFVVVLACAGALLGFHVGGLSEAIRRGLAVLLISCPCALGIATPMATWIALGRAARNGVLFCSGQAMEMLAQVRAFAFDKTGTLTTGIPQVSRFDSLCGDRDLDVAAGISQTSHHVLARGILDFAKTRNVSPRPVSQVQVIPGRGVTAQVNGDMVRLGNLRLLEEAAVTFDPVLRDHGAEAMRKGQSVVWIARNRASSGVFSFREELRPEVQTVLATLKRLGLHTEVLTGDHSARGAAMQTELGTSVLAELTPQAKVEEIKRLHQKHGWVGMIGDGLNDAPALAAADVGLAMGCGADISRESADVCLLGNDLTAIPQSVQLARATMRIIKGNLLWAFLYNAACIPLAMTGRLNPVIAAAAMVVSSLFVVMNSQRLGRASLDG